MTSAMTWKSKSKLGVYEGDAIIRIVDDGKAHDHCKRLFFKIKQQLKSCCTPLCTVITIVVSVCVVIGLL